MIRLKNLLKYELKKMYSTKAIYVCLIITIFLSAFGAYIYIQGGTDTTFEGLLVSAIPSSGFDLVLTALIPLMVCEEFSSGMMKMIVGKGYPREGIFVTKLIMAFLYTILLSLGCLITGFVAGLIAGYQLFFTGRAAVVILLQILTMLVIGVMSLTISILFRKKSLSLVVSMLSPSLIQLLLVPIDKLIGKISISSYWVADFMMSLSDIAAGKEKLVCVLFFTILYIVIFWLIGFFVNRTVDY